jgi:hypothetical protein
VVNEDCENRRGVINSVSAHRPDEHVDTDEIIEELLLVCPRMGVLRTSKLTK